MLHFVVVKVHVLCTFLNFRAQKNTHTHILYDTKMNVFCTLCSTKWRFQSRALEANNFCQCKNQMKTVCYFPSDKYIFRLDGYFNGNVKAKARIIQFFLLLFHGFPFAFCLNTKKQKWNTHKKNQSKWLNRRSNGQCACTRMLLKHILACFMLCVNVSFVVFFFGSFVTFI